MRQVLRLENENFILMEVRKKKLLDLTIVQVFVSVMSLPS